MRTISLVLRPSKRMRVIRNDQGQKVLQQLYEADPVPLPLIPSEGYVACEFRDVLIDERLPDSLVVEAQ